MKRRKHFTQVNELAVLNYEKVWLQK